jgi:hypothetical protein
MGGSFRRTSILDKRVLRSSKELASEQDDWTWMHGLRINQGCCNFSNTTINFRFGLW